MKKIKFSSPWEVYYKQIEALFGKDPDVSVEIIRDEYIIRLLVYGEEKAAALDALLPHKKEFGNIVVTTVVIPANETCWSKGDMFRMAFDGNPIVEDIREVSGEGFAATYVIFKKEVVQFFSDNLRSYSGDTSTIYEDLASEVFENPGVCFCTSTK